MPQLQHAAGTNRVKIEINFTGKVCQRFYPLQRRSFLQDVQDIQDDLNLVRYKLRT